MSWRPLSLSIALVPATLLSVSATASVADELANPLPVMASTLDRVHARLGAEGAYWIGYAVVEQRRLTVQGTHGVGAGTVREADRTLDVDVRVGSMELDNTHKIRDASFFSDDSRPSWTVPLSGPASSMERALVRGTDDVFRAARARLLKVRANAAVKVEREDLSADFSPAPPVVSEAAVPELPGGAAPIDVATWEALTASLSGRYLAHDDIHDSAVQLVVTQARRWIVNTEGSRVADGRDHFRVATWAETVAPDGMALSVYDYVDVASPDRLPGRAALEAMVDGVASRLLALRGAPLVEPWSGPAILRGRAAGVFFHEIFGHRVEGHRQKDEDEGQTFTQKVGERILPPFLDVVDDPTLPDLAGEDLNGHYAIDDEGVRARPVQLVDDGVLRTFLLGRSPVAGFAESNGHGRRQPGHAVVARQGNLVVSASAALPYAALRKRLLDEVRAQGKEFGLVFDDISGGFTFTGRSTPNSFVVQPVTVWRVFADGRPDQLVRGVDLIGTPLATFGRIVAAADDVDVFNGVCGAESGWVPVSAVAPSLLVSEVEVQRREKGNDRPPLLPVPK